MKPSPPACPWHAPRQDMHRKYGVPYWHLPPQYINDGSFSPYKSNKNNTQLFAIVRNPYTRVVSEWNYAPSRWADINNEAAMNEWLQGFLRRLLAQQDDTTLPFFGRGGHFVPQYEYFSSPDYPVVLLQQERLSQDFGCLMKQHGYQVLLPNQV